MGEQQGLQDATVQLLHGMHSVRSERKFSAASMHWTNE